MLNKNYRITKSNRLINAKEDIALTALDQKVLMACIIQVNEQNFEEKNSFRIQDFYGTPSLSTPHYNAFRKAIKSLSMSHYSIEEYNTQGELEYGKYRPFFKEIEVIKNSGTCNFVFNERLKKELIELKQNFTTYDYKKIQHLQSGFSIRIYELLMQGKNKYRSRKFEVKQLLNLFGLEKIKSYQTFSKIRQNILDPSCQEITEKTDINVHWEVSQKQGRKITHICFTWNFKEGVPLEVRMLHHNLKTSDNENNTQSEKLVKPQRDKKSEPKTTTEPISENPISTTNTEAATISPFVEDPIKESEERVQRLMQRLQSYGIDMFTAMRVCANTQASADSGIWKVLYDLKMAVNDQKISNPKAYLEKILKEQFY